MQPHYVGLSIEINEDILKYSYRKEKKVADNESSNNIHPNSTASLVCQSKGDSLNLW